MLSIIIPTYNEAGNIEKLLNQIDKAMAAIPYEVVFVDDSTDHTPEVLKAAAEKYQNVRYEHRTEEKGLASAVIRGFHIAKGDYLAVMDADLQHPPAILRGMYCTMLEGADICVPSRFIPGGSDGGLNVYRKLVSGGARYLGKIMIANLRYITDPTSGLFMFQKDLLKGARLKPIGWKILVEVLAMTSYQRVVEIPYRFQDRDLGESKLSVKVTLEYVQQLFGLLFRTRKNKGLKVEYWTEQELNQNMKKNKLV